jgi:hypothetical protein
MQCEDTRLSWERAGRTRVDNSERAF